MKVELSDDNTYQSKSSTCKFQVMIIEEAEAEVVDPVNPNTDGGDKNEGNEKENEGSNESDKDTEAKI